MSDENEKTEINLRKRIDIISKLSTEINVKTQILIKEKQFIDSRNFKKIHKKLYDIDLLLTELLGI